MSDPGFAERSYFLLRMGSCDFVDRMLVAKKGRSTKSHELTRTMQNKFGV